MLEGPQHLHLTMEGTNPITMSEGIMDSSLPLGRNLDLENTKLLPEVLKLHYGHFQHRITSGMITSKDNLRASSGPIISERKPTEPQQNRGPLQCQKCGGPHTRRSCPLKNQSARPTYNIQEEDTVGQVARVVPRIYVALEDCQENHHSTVVEVAGKIVEQSVSILIDLVLLTVTFLLEQWIFVLLRK